MSNKLKKLELIRAGVAFTLLSCGISFGSALCVAETKAATNQETLRKNYSYLLGRTAGIRYASTKINFDFESYRGGFTDASTGKRSKLSDKDMDNSLSTVEELKQKREEKYLVWYQQQCLKYLEDNAKRSTVKKTESGLQYEILTTGNGKKPGKGQIAVVNYSFSLIDGTPVELNPSASSPLKLQVGSIPLHGLEEAVEMMDAGSVYRFVIPDFLAFGDHQHYEIPPHSVLIAQLTLTEVFDSNEKK